jgi:hypothetical protein
MADQSRTLIDIVLTGTLRFGGAFLFWRRTLSR